MQTEPNSTEHGPQVVSSDGSADPLYFCIEWNPENQLTRVTKNAAEQARFKYDPKGRRVEKVAGAVSALWSYDGEDIVRQVSSGTTLKYIQGPVFDEPLGTDTGSGLSYLHADALGSVIKTTDAAGVVTMVRQYDVWGNLQAGTTTLTQGFTARDWDPETGLEYLRMRYYDPRGGRFLSEDPIGYSRDVNLYAYVNDDPVDLVDPSGLQVAYKDWDANPPYPAAGALRINLDCLTDCLGQPILVTSTSEPNSGHGPSMTRGPRNPFAPVPVRDPFRRPTDPHGWGAAADVTIHRASTDVVCCARACSFKNVLDEYKKPSAHATAGHFHVQIPYGPPGYEEGHHPTLKECMRCATQP